MLHTVMTLLHTVDAFPLVIQGRKEEKEKGEERAKRKEGVSSITQTNELLLY